MNQSKLERIQHKIIDVKTLSYIVQGWKTFNKKIVFTNGCFDILHKGHTTYLLQAAELGNKLIVAINTDSSVKKLKGEQRPIQDEQTRALNIAANNYVDYVVLFDEDTPLHIITTLLPDVLVKGGDYTEANIVGAKEVLANGGEVKIIPLIDGFSTTSIINKINS